MAKDERGQPRIRSHRVRAGALSVFTLGILLFTWPFVRYPLLGLGPSYVHLLIAWVAIVVALGALAHALGRASGRDASGHDAGGGAGDA